MIDLDYRFLIKRIDLHKAILETGRDDRYTYINYKVGLATAKEMDFTGIVIVSHGVSFPERCFR